MASRFICFIGVCLTLGLTPWGQADLRVASWNIQHFGWGENKSYQGVARVAASFDILAIQELMDAEALYRLQNVLEAKTGEPWEVLYSDALGSSRYKEKYGFIWRSSAVEYVDGAVSYIVDRDRFTREPFSARFRALSSDFTFVLATVHIVYGRRVSDRTPEVEALRGYFEWLAEVYPEDRTRRILLGDFNLRPSHEAWAGIREIATPLITEGATTLSTINGRYANLYDNIIVDKNHTLAVTAVGILLFPEFLSETTGRHWSHKQARRHVSDHAPVYALLGEIELHAARHASLAVPDLRSGEGGGLAEYSCIDLNEASTEELSALIHIGPDRAQRIVEGRPWAGIGELVKIPGLGAGRVRAIRDQALVCH